MHSKEFNGLSTDTIKLGRGSIALVSGCYIAIVELECIKEVSYSSFFLQQLCPNLTHILYSQTQLMDATVQIGKQVASAAIDSVKVVKSVKSLSPHAQLVKGQKQLHEASVGMSELFKHQGDVVAQNAYNEFRTVYNGCATSFMSLFTF